jgi:hypothetical protein
VQVQPSTRAELLVLGALLRVLLVQGQQGPAQPLQALLSRAALRQGVAMQVRVLLQVRLQVRVARANSQGQRGRQRVQVRRQGQPGRRPMGQPGQEQPEHQLAH